MFFRPSVIARSLVMKWLLCVLSCPFIALKRAQLDVSVIPHTSVILLLFFYTTNNRILCLYHYTTLYNYDTLLLQL